LGLVIKGASYAFLAFLPSIISASCGSVSAISGCRGCLVWAIFHRCVDFVFSRLVAPGKLFYRVNAVCEYGRSKWGKPVYKQRKLKEKQKILK